MKKGLYIAFLLLIGLVSCKKNQLKKPTDVQFRMVMDSPVNPVYVPHLQVTSGHVVIGKFIIEGERTEGENVFFNRVFSSGLKVDLINSGDLEDLKFDIPQGTFTSLDVIYETFNQGTDVAIQLDGVYTNQSQQNIPFRFEFNAIEDFLVAAIENGSGQIVLDKDVSETPILSINPNYWFQNININLWEDATLYDVDGVQTILINSTTNEDIYDEVLDYIEQSGELLFE